MERDGKMECGQRGAIGGWELGVSVDLKCRSDKNTPHAHTPKGEGHCGHFLSGEGSNQQMGAK